MAVRRSERHGLLRERWDRRMEAWRPPDFRGNLAGYVGCLRRSITERRSMGSRNVGLLRGLRPLCEQGIEIDQLRIVLLGFAVEPCAAMKMHQRLHTAGVEMVHMLMLQRYRQQRLGQPDQRNGGNLAHLVALAPKQGKEGVNQLPIDLCRSRLLRLRKREAGEVGVARTCAYRSRSQLPTYQVRRRENFAAHGIHVAREPGRFRYRHRGFGDGLDQRGGAAIKSRRTPLA